MNTIVVACVYFTFFTINISKSNENAENTIVSEQVKLIAKEVDRLRKEFTSIHGEVFTHVNRKKRMRKQSLTRIYHGKRLIKSFQ